MSDEIITEEESARRTKECFEAFAKLADEYGIEAWALGLGNLIVRGNQKGMHSSVKLQGNSKMVKQLLGDLVEYARQETERQLSEPMH